MPVASLMLHAALAAAGAGAAAQPPPGSEIRITVRAQVRTEPIAGDILALAPLADDRLAVLFAESLALVRIDAGRAGVESRLELPGPFRPVRRPGGIVLLGSDRTTCWVLTSRAAAASLVSVEAGRLAERARAAALPWGGAPQGLAFREGTNLIEGPLDGLGAGPFVAIEPAGPTAVTNEAVLVPPVDGLDDLRVGGALAPLFPGFLVVAAAAPPETADAILVVWRGGSPGVVARRIEVDGPVRALASSVRGHTARLVVAVAAGPDRTRLLLVDLERSQ
jgi:hypothetical protein